MLIYGKLVAIVLIQTPFGGKPQEPLPVLHDCVYCALGKPLLGGYILKSNRIGLAVNRDGE